MKKLFYLILTFSFSSCGKDLIFSESQLLPQEGWTVKNSVAFEAEIADSTAEYAIEFFLRHNDNYPNQNLWLFVSETAPDGEQKTDTLQYFLQDNFGRWLGSGGGVRYLSLLKEENRRFARNGKFRYEITHGMRHDTLPGLLEIGLEITKNEE